MSLAALLLACTLTLDAPRAVPTDYLAAVEDFDGDGRVELLTYWHDRITLLPSGTNISHYFSVSALKTGDIDGDGRPDIVSRQTSIDGTMLSLHRNLGGGTFAEQVELHKTSEEFLVGDFLTGGGDEVFTRDAIIRADGTKVTPLLGRQYFRIVTAGDFDGDGHLDLAGTDYGENVIFLRGEGNGRFPAVTTTRSGKTVWDIEVADFNGDGRDDAAVSNHGADTVSIFLDPLHGEPFTFATGDAPAGLLAHDFDADGDPDLAVMEIANSEGTTEAAALSIYRNDRNNSFTRIDRLLPGAPVAATDFTGDGAVDLLVASLETSSILEGNGDGTFDGPEILPSFVSYPVVQRAADLDGDGVDELLLTSFRSNDVVYVGRFGKGTETLPPAGAQVYAVDAGNLTGDPGLEVAAAAGSRVVVYGYAFGQWTERQSYGGFDQVSRVIVRDFTGDGRDDIAVLHATDRRLLLRVMNGDGNTLDEMPVTSSAYLTILPLDADGDGHVDLLVSGSGTFSTLPHDYSPQANGYVAIRFNDGSGQFSEEVRIAENEAFGTPVAGDFNGDGFDDVAVSTWPGYAKVRLFRVMSNGDRTYTAPESLDVVSLRPSWLQLTAGDLNGDGADDLAALESYRDVLLFDGMSARGLFLGGHAAGTLAMARVRDRARPSIVLPAGRSGEIIVLDTLCVRPRRRAV